MFGAMAGAVLSLGSMASLKTLDSQPQEAVLCSSTAPSEQNKPCLVLSFSSNELKVCSKIENGDVLENIKRHILETNTRVTNATPFLGKLTKIKVENTHSPYFQSYSSFVDRDLSLMVSNCEVLRFNSITKIGSVPKMGPSFRIFVSNFCKKVSSYRYEN